MVRKIIQIDSFSGLGGGQKVLFEIVKGLKSAFDFYIFVPPGLFLEKYSQLGVKVHRLREKKFIKIVKELRNFIREKKPAILHFHGTRAAIWGRLATIGLKNRLKIVYTLHGFHLPRRSFFNRWILLTFERFLNRWTDVLVCVSEADKKLVLKYRTIAKEKIIVIKNGIDIKKLVIDKNLVQNAEKKLGLQDKFIITSIGRLHPPKDFSTILKAFKIVLAEIKNVKLLIIGDGPLRESLGRETERLGLNEHVKFLGAREDISALISLSDIIILSTKWEGLPLVPLEAGAYKKPVVASDVDGVRETIINKKTGFLFKPGSAEDLAQKILKLLESEDLRRRMGKNAFYFVSENFNRERMVQDYKELYQSLK